MQVGVITNPNSRKNKGNPHRVAQLKTIVGKIGEVHRTDSVDSIKPILREFLRKRALVWVADGGDGALHWMLRCAMEVLEEDEFKSKNVAMPLTLPTNGGTIDFIANNVGIAGSSEGLLTRLCESIDRGEAIEEVEVDSMRITGVQATDDGDETFRTFGFAVAAGGVGQRFFSKYYEADDPNPRTIVKVVANAVASLPLAMSPFRTMPGLPSAMRSAQEIFKPTPARLTIDGMELPQSKFTSIHIASMSLNLGNVLRFFGKADADGVLHALVGSPSPFAMLRNLPRMHFGKDMRDRNILDRACRDMTVEAAGDELLDPVIDGEYYRNVRKMKFELGPRVRIPKVVAS